MIIFYVLESNRTNNYVHYYFRNYIENHPGFISTEDFMDAMAWNKRKQAIEFLKENGLDTDFHVEMKQNEYFPDRFVY